MNKSKLPRKVRFESQTKLVTFSENEPTFSTNLDLQEQEALLPVPDPGKGKSDSDSLLVSALTTLMADPNLTRYNDYFILYYLKGLIATYEPLIQPSTLPTPEVLSDCGAKCKKVSEAVRTKLARSCLTSCMPSDPSNQLKLGVVVYIGSPLSGEMVIINDQLVDEWITYTRAAIEKKVVTAHNDMLMANSLAQLVNLKVIPESRHMIKINYGSEANCFTSSHQLFAWTSTRSPCSITSCQYYK